MGVVNGNCSKQAEHEGANERLLGIDTTAQGGHSLVRCFEFPLREPDSRWITPRGETLDAGNRPGCSNSCPRGW